MQKLTNVFRSESKWRALFASIFTLTLGYGLYKGVLDNYLAEIVTMSEFDRGVSEFFRELPGLMLVLLLAALYTFSAEAIYKAGAVIMMAGMAMQSIVPADRVLVTAAICLYSLGEHMQLGMRNTLTLEYSRPGNSGTALGLVNAVSQVGSLAGFAVIIAVFLFVKASVASYKAVFWAATAVTVLGTLASLKLSGRSAPDSSKRRFYFRKKFMKYYMLEVFYGARKQVFLTFGPYVLILFYNADTAVISMLFAVSAVCGFLAAPFVGKIIDRFGYKVVMVSDTLILVVVCLFYGFAHHLFPMNVAFVVCCVNYVIDSIISLASMASNVYVQDIGSNAEEVRATISTGISVNHLVTIFIALFGGWIWKALGIETLFILSAVLGLCNSAYAATIKVKAK